MVKIPFNLDIHNLIDDLRNFSWKASEIFLYYSKMIKEEENKIKIIKTKEGEDPVTSADLKVNEFVIRSINEKYKRINWSILSSKDGDTKIPNSILIQMGIFILLVIPINLRVVLCQICYHLSRIWSALILMWKPKGKPSKRWRWMTL